MKKPWTLKVQPLPDGTAHLLIVKANGEVWGVPVHYHRPSEAEKAAASIRGAEVVRAGRKRF